jgi:hypothetical protein
MIQNYLDLAGLTAYDIMIKQWSKASIVDITDDAINALFVNPLEVPYVTFTAEENNSSIGLAKLSTNQTMEYSTDTTTWNTFDTTTNISINNGDKVYVRGVLGGDNTSSNYTQFKMSGKIAASGNCNAIWNYEDLNTPLKAYCGGRMFRDCKSLTTTPELPATTLNSYCYQYMFYGCTTLTTTPELPATTLNSYCYQYMFQNCTSLTTAPELPATVLVVGCYRSMFRGCTNLNYIKCLATDISASNCTGTWVYGVAAEGEFVKDPKMTGWSVGSSGIPNGWKGSEVDISPSNYVTFTAEGNSSIGLKKLSSSHKLYWSKNATDWYKMDTSDNISLSTGNKLYIVGKLSSADNSLSNYTKFKMSGKIAASGNCNAILNYEDLNAPLKAYCGYKMFYECTSLTTAPELPATTLTDNCYGGMFSGCTSLTIAPELPATTLADNCYGGMFKDCTSLTAAPELPATVLATDCYSTMFLGCSSLTQAPELPATVLADYCYRAMFYGCTSLTQAPELPATALKSWCYINMFYNCTSLNYIKCLATNISASNCTTYWVPGVSSTGTFVKHPDMTDWTTGTNGIPEGWEVVDAEL